MPLDIREHPTWVPTVHTLKTVADLREFYEKELAPERSAKNQWLPDLNQDGSNDIRDLAVLKERLYRIQDTDGDGIADTSKIMIEGFNVDPTYDVAGGLLYNQGDLLIGIAPGVWRLKDDNGDGTIDRQIVDQRGLQHPPGVRRTRHLGPDDGTRRPNLLGGRGHRPRRHGQERQALVLPEPGRGDALRARRLEFRSLRHRHPEPPGVLVRRVRQPDQRRQRRRSPGRDRARRLHPERLRQRMAFELAVWQVHRREEQPLQRLDGREHVQAALRGPGGAHHSSGGGVPRRSVGHGLQPGHGAHR